MTTIQAYNELMELSKELTLIAMIGSALQWDMETYMPAKTTEIRSNQLAYIAGLAHQKMTDPHVGDLLNKVESDPESVNLNEEEKRNMYLTRKAYDQATKLPQELVQDLARQSAVTNHVWKEAKAKRDFSIVKEHLRKLIELVKQRAKILAKVKNISEDHLYDVLLDDYEAGLTAEMVTKIFDEIKLFLVPIVQKCIKSPNQPDYGIIEKYLPIDYQRKLAEYLAHFVQYDLQAGRIDETEHPFTIGEFTDVRITTHYFPKNVMSSIYSVLHESGHALYGQNLSWIYQPIGSACSFGIHESQSRFVENIVGRSHEFWAFFLPKFKEMTGVIFQDLDVDSVVRAVNRVELSKIRVEADEVTYALHVIIRYEIESALFADEITVDDLPAIWNKKYKDYLGLTIENDSEGVMQDTHWYGGSFGYFPTYVLGNIYSAQLMNTMDNQIPHWRLTLEEGNFQPVKKWLNEHIHRYGNLYDPLVLLEKATGEPLNVNYFKDYITQKYSKLYGF